MDEIDSVAQQSITQEMLNESRRSHPGSKASPEGHLPYNLTMENNSPLLVPSGLNSMLNTTETGDIGIFSIKPSRLPRHPAITRAAGRTRSNGGSHRRAESQLPYHGPRVFSLPSTIDDRTRLPSYSRDATSDVASLYESSSQKSSESSKILEDQDRRSFSGYRLPNPHSSTSLSNQIDQNDAQRPRSSYQYPARLKRPGFRPSSPALTDGGVVDYSRRVEIQREASNLNCQNVSLRPLSLRSDVNRSTPTASRQSPSPHSSKRIPVIQRVDSLGESSGNNDTAELASKASLCPVSAFSTNTHLPNHTTPPAPTHNKAHHPSPLYYDYAEDFFIEAREGGHGAEDLEGISPPPFLIEKTIHEDRELSSDRSYLAMTDLQGRGFLANGQVLLPHDDAKDLTSQPPDISYVGSGKLRFHDGSESGPENTKQHKSLIESTKLPTPELNVGSIKSKQSPSQSIESGSSTENSKLRNFIGGRHPTYTEPESQCSDAVDELALHNSPPSVVSSRLQGLFSPSSGLIRTCTDSKLPINTQTSVVHDVKRKPLSCEVSEIDETDSVGISRNTVDPVTPTQSPQHLGITSITPILQRSISAQDKRDKSSPYFRARPSSAYSTQPHMILEDLNPSAQPQDLPFGTLSLNYAESLDSNESSSMPLRRYKQPFHHSLVTFPVRNYKSDGSLAGPKGEFEFIQASGKCNQNGNSGMEFDQAGSCGKAQLVGGREGFIVADVVSPIPIHPKQQFLAPPPTDDSEVQPKTPVLLNTPTSSGQAPVSLLNEESSAEPIRQHFFSKFRVKTRASTVRTRPSPPVTQRRDLDGSYPLDDHRRNIQLFPNNTSLRRPVSLTPKLKLKVGRASVSSLGTVRINREAAVQGDLGDSEILGPEDLFTPPPRLANLFRRVSRHFQPKDEYEEVKAPETPSIGELDETGPMVMSNDPNLVAGGGVRTQDPNYPQMHPRSSAFVGTPLSPCPCISRGPPQDRMSPESSQRAQQQPRGAGVIPADIQAGGTQGCFSDYGSQLEESSHLQSNIPNIHPEQPSHHLEAGSGQAPVSAPWRTRNAWDQFQAPDFTEMYDEFDNDSTEPSRRLKAIVNGWLQDIKTTMFGCGKSRR